MRVCTLFRALSFAAVLLLGVELATHGTAAACAGPCGAPELWDLHALGSELSLVTNFGLIAIRDDTSELACEETFGGLLLDVGFIGDRARVSTGAGVFTMGASTCSFSPGPINEHSEWLTSFDLVAGDPVRTYGLANDIQTGEQLILLSTAEGNFEPVARFDAGSGFQQLMVGADEPLIFLSGYTFMPRTFHLAFSLDDGETWISSTPPVDNERSSFAMVGVAPNGSLLLHADTAVGTPDELYRFDPRSRTFERVLILEGEADLGGVAFDASSVFVGSRTAAGGSIFVSDGDDFDFTEVSSQAPPLSCLEAREGVLYGCVNDFSVDSPFIVGRSDDGGHSWRPLMLLGELGRIRSCGSECDATTTWLHATYGNVPVPVPDAGALGPRMPSPPDAGDASNPRRTGDADTGCSCRTSGPAKNWAAFWCCGLWLYIRHRRAARAPNSKASGIVHFAMRMKSHR